MEITKILSEKSKDIHNKKNPTIAFLGDSVTQGCFEIYITEANYVETVFDQKHAFSKYISDMLGMLYPNVQVNIINAGISGDNATHAYERLEQDILKYNPDLTIVCFGLNDCYGGTEGIPGYANSLKKIFEKLKANGSEVIFLTPNMMNTRLSCFVKEQQFIDIAENTMRQQNTGILERYVEAAKETAEACEVKVCDVYAKWKQMAEIGIDTTLLLSNYINHPTREMNYLTAFMLLDCMLT